jgi:hypothetical protein
MFEAGRAAAGHSARRWQAISGVLVVALTVSLAGWSWVAGGPGPRSGGEGPVSSWAVVSDADAGRPEDHPPAVASRPHYLALRDRVLAEGVDALPTAKGRTTPVPDTWAEDLFPDMPPAWRPSIGAGQRERS